MAPTIILIRHGEAEHNATLNYDILDPPLTPLGRQQCKDLETHLRKDVPIADQVEAIITSPFTRTIETTLLGLDWLIQRGIKIEADALWQENSAKPCDTGSPAKQVAENFPQVDLSNLDPVYPDKSSGTVYEFSHRAILARGGECIRNLHSRKEKVIAVVSHSGFLRAGVSHRMYANADFRIFTFRDLEFPDSVPCLIESELTAGKGGLGRSDPGYFPARKDEFPPEKKVEDIRSQQGERTEGEATREVPK